MDRGRRSTRATAETRENRPICSQMLAVKKVLRRATSAPMANHRDTRPTVAASTTAKRMSRMSQTTLETQGMTISSFP